MTIQSGDWIRVPKGTALERDYSNGYGDPEKPTAREVIVQVSSVAEADYHDIRRLLTEEEKSAFESELRPFQGLSSIWGKGHTDETRAAAKAGWEGVEQKYRSLLEERVGSLTTCYWSNDRKGAYVRDVEKVDAPAPKKKPEPKINKKQQMVKGSKWKLTADVDITFPVGNPAVAAGIQAFDHANPQPDWDSPVRRQWHTDREAERDRLVSELGKHIDKVVRKCKAGEIFTVTDKFSTYNIHDILADCGAIAWVQFDGDPNEMGVRYKQVEPIMEAESIPTVDVYVLRNKTTGQFFKSTEYNKEKTKEALDLRDKSPNKHLTSSHSCARFDPVFVETFMKAKHFENVGRAKSSILEATGYYHELPGSENLPEWMGHSASFDFTEDYELVKFDKLAREEVEVIDLWEWYQQAWKLRELTVKYGSSVRSCYKELEKKNMLDERSGMVVFTASEDAQERVGYWGDRSALTTEDKEEITSAIAVAGLKKGKYKRGEDAKSIAVSFADKSAALMFKLSYNGNLKMTVLDLKEMREVVEEQAA